MGVDNRTDEHLISTPNGMVRNRALKRKAETRRWDPSSLERDGVGLRGHRHQTLFFLTP